MTKRQAKHIFEKYNPQSAVIRCPNGRTSVRKMLDIYAKAAVNLYGIIPLKDFVEIFNSHNTEQTDADEVVTLLLPGIIKNIQKPQGGFYCFYKDCIVHYWAVNNFDLGDFWLREQRDKPRFIPKKSEFTQYEDEYYEDEVQEELWDKVLEFILQEWPKTEIFRLYEELKFISQFSGRLDFNDLFEKYNLVFSTKKHAQQFFDLINNAHNNTRMWNNKGHSPNEMMEMRKKQYKEIVRHITIQKHKNIGVNEPCPCGSGKKHKKCCRLVKEVRTAQLHWSECTLFYETWYGLMGFVNEKKKNLPVQIQPIYPNPVSDELMYKVREAFWKNPVLINDYISSASLPKSKIELLQSWRDHHIKGMFFLMEYTPEYAVLMGSDKKKGDILYGIKGISRSIADTVQRDLPVQLETVLLPFKDKIIYDGFLSSMQLSFGKNIREAFFEMYQKAMENGIITCLVGG